MTALTLTLALSFGGIDLPENLSGTDLLEWLEGSWRFELGSRRGTRSYFYLPKSKALRWSERFDGGDVVGEGHLVFDPKKERFFSWSLHNRAGAFDMMSGVPNCDGTQIEYRSLIGDTVRIVWRRTGPASFVYEAYPEGAETAVWRAEFERIIGRN